MKKLSLALISMLLVLSLMLGGCGLDFGGYFENLGNMLGGSLTNFENMEYRRPDMTEFSSVLDESVKQAGSQKNVDKLIDQIYAFYEVFDDFYTAYALSNIYYSKDLRDTYWEGEYNFCMEQKGTADAGLDRLYRALAKSPIRSKLETEEYFGAGFFAAYDGESIYDDAFNALLSQEAQLQGQYYAISGEAADADYYSDAYFSTYGQQLAEVYVELIRVRQQMATHAGYESYPEFAYEFYYGRDYTCRQAAAYLADIQAELVPLYRQMNGNNSWLQGLKPATQQETFSYVKNMAGAMGGVVQEAFEAMEAGNLYDITYSPYKADTSFEIFVSDYMTPYIFLNPSNTSLDQLTFAHEFGHFCADYASSGSAASVDVAEIFSQGMEYLSLSYLPNAGLKKLKMGSCLATYVEQAAYASFELQVYSLEGENLTPEHVRKIYETIGTAFGFDGPGWDSREYVLVPHFFISPMYVVSYVVSNDVALQLYILEQTEKGKGLACLTDNLTTQQTGIQAFVKEAGLTSPFADGWLATVRQTLQKEIFG